MRRVTYLVCALLGVLAAVSIAFLPAGTELDSVTGTSYISPVYGSTAQIHVMNTGNSTATCEVKYVDTLGSALRVVSYVLNANKPTKIIVGNDVGTSFKGTVVINWQAQKKLTISLFDKYGTGPGSNAPAVTAPATTWVNTSGRSLESGKQEYFGYSYVYNPNSQDVNAVANFYGSSGKIGTQTATVPAGGFKSLPGYMNTGTTITNYTTVATASKPIIATSNQYSYSSTGSSTQLWPFQSAASTKYYDPGSPLFGNYSGSATYQFFNGDPNTAHVTTSYWRVDEMQGTSETTIAPYTTQTITTSGLTKYDGGSLVFNSDKPIFGSGTYYWRVDEVDGSSQTNLSPQSGQVWSFTAGETGTNNETWYGLYNPGAGTVTGTATFYPATGDPNSIAFSVPPNKSKFISASQGIRTGSFGTVIKTDSPTQGIIASQHLFWGGKRYGSVDFGESGTVSILMSVSPETLPFLAFLGTKTLMTPASFKVSFTPNAALAWTATTDVSWIKSLRSGTGSSSADESFSIDATNMRRGIYAGTITITAPGASNSPQHIGVGLAII